MFMQKVCFILGEFPVASQTFVVNQIVAAINNGFDVTIIAYSKQSILSASQTKLIEQYRLLDRTHQVDFRIPKNNVRRLLKGIVLSFKYFKYLNKNGLKNGVRLLITIPFKIDFYLKLRETDVFHVHFGHYGLDVSLMKKMGVLNGRIITTFHGYDANLINDKETRRLIKQYHDLFVQSSVITVNTSYLKSILQKMLCQEEKLKIIPMGIDINFFNTSIKRSIAKESTISLLSVGRLIELKGHQYAIQAINVLVQKGYKIRYTIIGEGRLKEKLLKLIKEIQLLDSVFLVGKKSQYELKDFLDQTHIFLMPSVKDSDGRCESQGIVSLEAQASGVPIVAFDSGGVKYTLIQDKTGFLVPEKDVNAFADAIETLITNRELYRLFSQSAPGFVKHHYNIDNTSEEFITLYNNS